MGNIQITKNEASIKQVQLSMYKNPLPVYFNYFLKNTISIIVPLTPGFLCLNSSIRRKNLQYMAVLEEFQHNAE